MLEREPENAAGARAEAAGRRSARGRPPRRRSAARPPKPEQPAEVETPGIPERAGEAWAGLHGARRSRSRSTFADGKSSLDKQDYAAALARFRLVDRDQPKYQGVDALIADAVASSRKRSTRPINSGQQNEQAGKLIDARRWYQRALQIDPARPSAREKRARRS